MLLQRKELTSGSTWHAAGLLPLFNLSYPVGQLHRCSVRFYKELQEETGMNVGFSNVTNIRLARTPDRMDEYLYYAGIAETIGVPVKFLTPEELKGSRRSARRTASWCSPARARARCRASSPAPTFSMPPSPG